MKRTFSFILLIALMLSMVGLGYTVTEQVGDALEFGSAGGTPSALSSPPLTPYIGVPSDDNCLMSNEQFLEWGLPQGSPPATGYDLYIDGSFVFFNSPSTSYLISNQNLSVGQHSCYVIARNQYGASPPSETRYFEIISGTVIGSGNNFDRDPFFAGMGYSRSLTLYTASQIGQSGYITDMGWSVANFYTEPVPYKIYVKTTSSTALTAMTWNEFTMGATVVKQGTTSFVHSSWQIFELDAPFYYSTSSNLLIGVETNCGDTAGSGGTFNSFRFTMDTANIHQYWRQNDSPPTGNGVLSTRRPNLFMLFANTINSFPHLDGFEQFQADTGRVQGWRQVRGNITSQYWRANSSETNYNRTPRTGSFNATLQAGCDTWMMKPISLFAGRSYDVEVWSRQDGTNPNNATVGIYHGANGTISAMSNIIATQTGVVDGEYQPIFGTFTAEATGTHWIGIRGTVASGASYLIIDDFQVKISPTGPELTYAPAIINFTTGAVNIPTEYQDVLVRNTGHDTLVLNAADISIIGPGAAMFEFEPSNLPFVLTRNQSSTIPVRYHPTEDNMHNATLRMVYNGNNYDVTLSGHIVSEFALAESFDGEVFPPPGWRIHHGGNGDTWVRSTVKPRTGEAHAMISFSQYSTYDEWMITPRLAPSAGNHFFSFYGCVNDEFYVNRFNVKVSTTGYDISCFTHTLASNVSTGAMEYMYHSFDLSEFIGQNIYVAIQGVYLNGWRLFLDDVSGPDVVEEGTLPAPVVRTTMSGSWLTLEWDPVPGASLYRIYVSEDPYGDFSLWDTVGAGWESYTVMAWLPTRFYRVTSVSYREAILGDVPDNESTNTGKVDDIKSVIEKVKNKTKKRP